MSKLTRNGITYDLENSPYEIVKEYSNNTIIYSFSSKLYTEKFKEKLEENRAKINQAMSKRYGLNISFNILSDIILYSKIEKRGFYLQLNEEIYTCLNNIKLDGVNKTDVNYTE